MAGGPDARGSATLLFGGAADGPTSPTRPERWDVSFICPTSGEPFTDSVAITPPGPEPVTSVSSMDPSSLKSVDAEFVTWASKSADTGRGYGQALLTLTSTMIPTYFVVITFIVGTNDISGTLRLLTIIPPVLFILSIAVLGAAIRPSLKAVSPATFESFRARRLQAMATLVNVGLALSILGIIAATSVWMLLALGVRWP